MTSLYFHASSPDWKQIKYRPASDRWLQLYIAQLLLIRIQTRRAAPYFQVLRKLLHVDFLHEDEVPEADIGVDGHGGGVSLYTEHCVCGGESCLILKLYLGLRTVEGLALSHRHSPGSDRGVEQSKAEPSRAEQVSVSLTLLHTAQVTSS